MFSAIPGQRPMRVQSSWRGSMAEKKGGAVQPDYDTAKFLSWQNDHYTGHSWTGFFPFT